MIEGFDYLDAFYGDPEGDDDDDESDDEEEWQNPVGFGAVSFERAEVICDGTAGTNGRTE